MNIRIEQCLPENWLSGWNNVLINVTAENEYNAYLRVPMLLDLPIKHRGIVIEPMLEKMDIRPLLSSGLIEIVTVGGESYKGYDGLARELDIKWVRDIKEQCEEYEVPFYFHQTGTRFKLDNNRIITVNKRSDECGLAEFYGFDIEEIGGINWEYTVKELEMRSLEEEAQKVYKQITLKDLGVI